MLSPEEQDKKLVKQYKKTNKILRKQLETLNQQIDALIIQKSNRIGLQKLPKVEKQITDTKVIHHEVQNLKKRLQHIKHDNEEYKKKIQIDWLEKYKELQTKLDEKISEKQTIMKKIKIYEKKLNEQKTQVNLRKEEDKLLKELQTENEELARVRKIEKELRNFINTQMEEDNKKTSFINDLQNQQKKLMQKSQLQPKKVVQQKSIPKGHLPDYQWQKLKKDFLQLKESKQQDEMYLYEQNDRLRKEIKFLNQQLKVKKTRVDVVQKYSALEPEKKLSSRLQKIAQRNTIDATNVSESKRKKGFSSVENMKQNQSVRYRDRNNSISYN